DSTAPGAFRRPQALGQGTQKNQGWIFDRRRHLGETRRGSSAAPPTARISGARETQIDLQRRTAAAYRLSDRTAPYFVPPGADGDRTAELDRAQPAEHPHPHRGRPPHPARV